MASYKRQTHEQLRIDHIETLEELQKAKNEVDRLQSELKKYESATPSDNGSGISPAKPAKDESLVEYVEKIRKLEKELQEMKALMRRTALEDQQRFNGIHARTIEEFSQQLNRMQLRDREVSVQVVELRAQLESKKTQEELLAAMQGELTSLRAQLTLQTATASNRAQELLNSSEEKSRLLTALEQIKEELAAAQEARRSCLACDLKQKVIQDRDISLLERQRECDRWQHQTAEYVQSIHALQKEVDELKSRLSSCSSTPTRNQAMDFRDSDSEDEAGRRSSTPTPSFCSAGVSQSQSAASNSPEEPHKAVSEASPRLAAHLVRAPPPRSEEDDSGSVLSSGPMSVRFQEFIRLKRENKELKMRLADLYSSSGTSHAPSLHAQMSAPNLAVLGPQASGLGSERAPASMASSHGNSVAGPLGLPLRKSSSALRLLPVQAASRVKSMR